MTLADTIEEFNLDGVDFTAVQWDIMDEAGVAEMIKKLREYMPNKLISVTLPIHQSAWNTLIRGCEPYVDYFNIYGANSNDLWFIEDDIPKSKIVWGVEIARGNSNLKEFMVQLETFTTSDYLFLTSCFDNN